MKSRLMVLPSCTTFRYASPLDESGAELLVDAWSNLIYVDHGIICMSAPRQPVCRGRLPCHSNIVDLGLTRPSCTNLFYCQMQSSAGAESRIPWLVKVTTFAAHASHIGGFIGPKSDTGDVLHQLFFLTAIPYYLVVGTLGQKRRDGPKAAYQRPCSPSIIIRVLCWYSGP